LAVLLSLVLAVAADILLAGVPKTSLFLTILIRAMGSFPFWFGIYMILAFAVNFLIGGARFEDE